jgi:hypothetical protein
LIKKRTGVAPLFDGDVDLDAQRRRPLLVIRFPQAKSTLVVFGKRRG